MLRDTRRASPMKEADLQSRILRPSSGHGLGHGWLAVSGWKGASALDDDALSAHGLAGRHEVVLDGIAEGSCEALDGRELCVGGRCLQARERGLGGSHGCCYAGLREVAAPALFGERAQECTPAFGGQQQLREVWVGVPELGDHLIERVGLSVGGSCVACHVEQPIMPSVIYQW